MNMWTTISISDALNDCVKVLARRLGISQNELLERAVASYIESHNYAMVREALDEIYSDESSEVDED